MLPFRSLDPFRPLREPDRRRRDEERLSRSEQRTANKPKDHLTGKAPYRFESVFPPAASQQRTVLALCFDGAAPSVRSTASPRETFITLHQRQWRRVLFRIWPFVGPTCNAPDDERDYEVGYGKPPRHSRGRIQWVD